MPVQFELKLATPAHLIQWRRLLTCSFKICTHMAVSPNQKCLAVTGGKEKQLPLLQEGVTPATFHFVVMLTLHKHKEFICTQGSIKSPFCRQKPEPVMQFTADRNLFFRLHLNAGTQLHSGTPQLLQANCVQVAKNLQITELKEGIKGAFHKQLMISTMISTLKVQPLC